MGSVNFSNEDFEKNPVSTLEEKSSKKWYWICSHFTEKAPFKIHYEVDSVIDKIKSRG